MPAIVIACHTSIVVKRVQEISSTVLDRSPQNQHENLSQYVAELQLHMTLQARNLVPSLGKGEEQLSSRDQLLQETQAQVEKLVSRQTV